jgi:hypothetical protein
MHGLPGLNWWFREMRIVTVQNKDDGIFFCCFNMKKKVSKPVCKDITVDATGRMTGIDWPRRCAIHNFHFHILARKDTKWRGVLTGRTHTGNYCDKISTLCCLQSRYLAISFKAKNLRVPVLNHRYNSHITILVLRESGWVFHSWFKWRHGLLLLE